MNIKGMSIKRIVLKKGKWIDMENEQNNNNLPVCQKPSEVVPIGNNQYPSSDLILDSTCRELIRNAIGMLKRSYAPYSNVKVGAALLTKDNKIYTGCNVENAAFTPSNCAERTAFFKAISEGDSDFRAIAVVGGKNGNIKDYISPCGVCRQVMVEFCDPDKFLVIMAKSEDDYWIDTLANLLPNNFSIRNI